MTVHNVRLPDVGEGIAEAELVSWFVAVGDAVTPDDIVAEVLTDKATVEIYAPVAGTVVYLRGAPGDVLAVGGEFVGIEEGDEAGAAQIAVVPQQIAVVPQQQPAAGGQPAAAPQQSSAGTQIDDTEPTSPAIPADEAPTMPEPAARRDATVTAAPAVRERARRLGIDLAEVRPANPDQRIRHDDLDRYLVDAAGSGGLPPRGVGNPPSATGATQAPLIGLRRRIAAKMTGSLRIPHITYVEEIDMTQLEHLRASLVAARPGRGRLTILPFAIRAIVLAVAEQPNLNATFDDEAQPEVLTTHAAAHVGIATQTASGLIVPVVRNAQALDLWQIAAELARVTDAARDGTATREELAGSTITITSLGALGGLVTTPIINQPEVAIVGINKMQTRPMWDGTAFVPRLMMNLSSSFDHRVVDGYDAATFVQRIKVLLEAPAMLFLGEPSDQ